MRLVFIALVFAGSIGGLQAEEEHSFWWYTKAKVACFSDVIRLCKSAMPDQDKVTACMKTKKSLVSSDCAEFYPGGSNAE